MTRLFTAIALLCLLPSAAIADGIGPKPGRWCGWFMQHETGITSKATGLNLNRAIEWRKVGQATSAAVGAIVVWAHHVGVIDGGPDEKGRWLVRSGNDGNAVRTRYRSLRGVVAFRSVNGVYASSSDNYSVDQKAPARRNKHLVAHAVGGRVAKPLREAGTFAVAAGEPTVMASSAPAHVADFTHEVVRHQRKPMRKPQGPLVGGNVYAGGPIDAVSAIGEPEFSHGASPRIRLAQGVDRPSSRALQGLGQNRLRAHSGPEFSGRALYVDAAVEMNATLRPEQSPGYKRRYTRGLPTEVTASRRGRGHG